MNNYYITYVPSYIYIYNLQLNKNMNGLMRNFVFDQYLDEYTNTQTPLIQITVIASKLRRKTENYSFCEIKNWSRDVGLRLALTLTE